MLGVKDYICAVCGRYFKSAEEHMPHPGCCIQCDKDLEHLVGEKSDTSGRT